MSRRRIALRAVAIAAVALCALSGVSAVTQTVNAANITAELTVQVENAKGPLATAVKEQAAAEKKRDEAQAEHDVRAAVLAERPAFLAAVKQASEAFASADGKVDVAALRKAVLDAQNIVLTEKTDPDNVKTQAAAVAKAADTAVAEVKEHDERVAAEAAARRAARNGTRSGWSYTPSAGNSGGGGGGWFADMRQRLNNAGGGHVALVEYDGQCGGVWAVACASPGVIKVNSGIASWSNSRKNWAMVHEYAHQFYFNMHGSITGSAGYRQLFGSNPELLANCMASARGYTDHGHNGQCYGDRLSWAAAIWGGNVPW